MTSRRTGSFDLELELPYPPARVFAAFAELPRRKRWFNLPGGSSTATHALDFRVGGREVLRDTFASGDALESVENRAVFHAIVPGARLVYSFEAILGGRLRWVSLVTVELTPTGANTHLAWTEQFSFVELSTPGGDNDVAHLRGGTRLLLNGLLAAIED